MSQDQKDKTRDKMRRGGLPGPTKDEPLIRSGVGHRCDGCDEKIDVGETEYNVTVLSLRFHEACHKAWATFRR